MMTIARRAGSGTTASFAHVLSNLSRSRRGSVGIITGLTLPVMLGFGGLGVDVSLWLRAKSSVQRAADASALSVAASVGANDPNARWLAEGNAVAAQNGYQNGQNGVVVSINTPPTSGSYTTFTSCNTGCAFEVIISAPQRLYLASYFAGLQAPTVTGRAVALAIKPQRPPTCILALNAVLPPPSNGTIATSGGATVTANNCDVDADTTSAKSINSNGGGTIHALDVITRGDIDGSVNITATRYLLKHYGPMIVDPYLGQRSIPTLPAFQPSSANGWGQNGKTVSIQNPSGVIAYQGDVTVKGTVNLDPGVYIIADGNFSSTGTLNGTGGVTIVLTTTGTKSGTFSFSGGALMNLAAPLTGSTRGIALWADRQLTLDASDNFVGGSTNGIVGSIYLPSHLVKYAGNQGAVTQCMQLIADQITFTGTPTFNHNCGTIPILDPIIYWNWRLVE